MDIIAVLELKPVGTAGYKGLGKTLDIDMFVFIDYQPWASLR